MTRGMKGCYVYFCDKPLSDYFASQLKPDTIEQPQTDIHPKTENRIQFEVNDDVKFIDYLPYYSLKAACGKFGSAENVEESGWVLADGNGKLDKRYFVVKASGHSMEPKIQDGDFCVFRANVTGSRNGKIVLVQMNRFDDDYHGSYTIKRYESKKDYDKETGEWKHEEILLQPLNSRYDPIILHSEDEENYAIIAEFITIL